MDTSSADVKVNGPEPAEKKDDVDKKSEVGGGGDVNAVSTTGSKEEEMDTADDARVNSDETKDAAGTDNANKSTTPHDDVTTGRGANDTKTPDNDTATTAAATGSGDDNRCGVSGDDDNRCGVSGDDDNRCGVGGAGDGTETNKSCRRQKVRYDMRIIEALIERGCDVNDVNKNQQTPLHVACLQGQRALVDFLLTKGAKLDVFDDSQRDPFMNAMYLNHSHLFDAVYRKVDAAQECKYMHFAAAECSADVVQMLLDKGVSPLLTNDRKQVPLITAIEAHNVGAVKVLARASRDSFSVADDTGRCAWHHAMEVFNVENTSASVLLDNDADVDTLDASGYTTLLAHIDDDAKVEFLLSRGASPDFVAANGHYPLLAACMLHHSQAEKCVRTLLKYNVDMMSSQRVCDCTSLQEAFRNVTPLQLAIENDNYELTLLLLAAAASLNRVHDWLALRTGSDDFGGRHARWHRLFAYIREHTFEPMGLKASARLVILRALGRGDEVVDKIVKLEIPVILQNYLNWQTYIGDRMEFLKE